MEAERKPAGVAVVSRDPKLVELLRGILPPSQFSPFYTAENGGELRRLLVDDEPGVIIINAPLPDEFGAELAVECAELTASGIVLLVKAERYAEISYSAENGGVLVLPKPVGRGALFSAAKLAYAVHMRLIGARRQNDSLREKMGEIRDVNRAKLLLISRLGMTEEQAHRYVEKRAMDMRVTRREVAVGIIRTYGQD